MYANNSSNNSDIIKAASVMKKPERKGSFRKLEIGKMVASAINKSSHDNAKRIRCRQLYGMRATSQIFESVSQSQ